MKKRLSSKYDDPAKVRAINGQKFIDDFNSVYHIWTFPILSKVYLSVLKMDVWSAAKRSQIRYEMQKRGNGSTVMVIV